jgi:hypothetical protein
MHGARFWAGEPAVARLVKLAGVSALGRFVASGRYARLTLAADAPSPANLSLPYGVQAYRRQADTDLLPVGSYVYATARLSLHARALPEARAGALVQLYTDALYTTRDGGESDEALGGWKVTVRMNARVPRGGWLYSDSKVATPGRAA